MKFQWKIEWKPLAVMTKQPMLASHWKECLYLMQLVIHRLLELHSDTYSKSHLILDVESIDRIVVDESVLHLERNPPNEFDRR